MKNSKVAKYIFASITLLFVYSFRDIFRYMTPHTNLVNIFVTTLTSAIVIYFMISRRNNTELRYIIIIPQLLAILFNHRNDNWDSKIRLEGFNIIRELNVSSIASCYAKHDVEEGPVLCFSIMWDLESDSYHNVVYSPTRELQKYGGTNSEDWVRMLKFIPTVRVARLTMLSATDLGHGFYDIRVPDAAFEG